MAEGLVETLAAFHAIMPNLHWTIEDVLADGDKVALRSRTSDTARATFAAPGASLSLRRARRSRGQELCGHRFHGGRVVEFWAEMDWVNIPLQMGVIPGRTVVEGAAPAAEARSGTSAPRTQPTT